jgi:hypothetical protein
MAIVLHGQVPHPMVVVVALPAPLRVPRRRGGRGLGGGRGGRRRLGGRGGRRDLSRGGRRGLGGGGGRGSGCRTCDEKYGSSVLNISALILINNDIRLL